MSYRDPGEYRAAAVKLAAVEVEQLANDRQYLDAIKRCYTELMAVGDVWSVADVVALLHDCFQIVDMRTTQLERLREIEEHADAEIMDNILRECWAENDAIFALDAEIRTSSKALAAKWAAEDGVSAAC